MLENKKMDKQTQLSPTKEEKVLSIIVGLVCMVIGLGFLVLNTRILYSVVFITWKNVILIEFLLLFGTFLSLMLFFLMVGYRLLFNRPNKHGLLLPPIMSNVLSCFLSTESEIESKK